MSATTRTDIHRPSAPEFDPEAYSFHGVFDFAPEWNATEVLAQRQAVVSALVARGYKFGGGTRGCGHCGANFRYGALVARADVREMIYVGETCLNGRFSVSKAEYTAAFRKVRDRAAAGRARNAHVTAVAEFKAAHPGLEILDDREVTSRSKFLADLACKLERNGHLSALQVTTALRIGATIAAQRRRAERAERAAPVAVVAPEGLVTVTGTVKLTKIKDTSYGATLKMRVVADEGYAVWVTVPSSLNVDDLRGRRVRFTAVLRRSEDDRSFAYGSRPTCGEFA